ncbi:MAG: type II toxin-antitoxin system Phd/YefM family antitoxin [Deltaproteobacteria bacterium]
MIRLNFHEAKIHLSSYLQRLLKGETILLCRRNVPVAELRPIKKERKSKRPIGLAKGKLKIPKDFFKPLPEEITRLFSGEQK